MGSLSQLAMCFAMSPTRTESVVFKEAIIAVARHGPATGDAIGRLDRKRSHARCAIKVLAGMTHVREQTKGRPISARS